MSAWSTTATCHRNHAPSSAALLIELGILKDRAQLALMLPEHAAADLMPWRQHATGLAAEIDAHHQDDGTAP